MTSYHLLTVKKGIKLVTDIEENLPALPLDKARISQVLNNLLSNAFKFSPKNSTIKIVTRRNKNYVETSVVDEGIGIHEEAIHKMFKKFSQVGSKAPGGEKGTGLGLAIVKKIVDLHGGNVWVKSKVGKGSTFTFSLPVDRPESKKNSAKMTASVME